MKLMYQKIAKFEKLRIDKLNAAATCIQRITRGILERKKYARIKRASLAIQAGILIDLCIPYDSLPYCIG